MRTVITYGTFDLFHIGHLRLLQRLRLLGDRLIVGVSTDEFNATKGKHSFLTYEHRCEVVKSIRYVDEVIREDCWDQKTADIENYSVDVFGIGDDWSGKFDFLKDRCEVVYLPRTDGVSSTSLKRLARALDKETISRLSEAHQIIRELIHDFNGGLLTQSD
jgi:glycerol-3-phosphate cytidylyltransferase